MRFKMRVEHFAKDFIVVWKNARQTKKFKSVPKAIKFFINHINTRDIADEEYPLYRSVGYFKNSFCFVRLLKALTFLCGGGKGGGEFLRLLTLTEPTNFLYQVALSQWLLQQGEYRRAADVAILAGRLRALDLCVSKTIVRTQKALHDNRMTPDYTYVLNDHSDRFCKLPFTLLNVFSRSINQPLTFSLCQCRGWMPMAFPEDFSWNNQDAQELRLTILNGSFHYCNELRCPFLANNILPRREDVNDDYLREIITNNITNLPKGPEELTLGYDTTCNLSCPSCRDKVHVADPQTTQFLNKTMDRKLPSLLADVNTLCLSQTGEALASPHYRRLLRSITPSKYPNLKIKLMSNLKLISQQTWAELGPTADNIKTLLLSIDGATPSTLEKLRRGLTWERMTEALAFARELRKSSKINHISVMFVIQKDNFRELPLMLELCSRYCVDHLSVARISSHGTYTHEQFRNIDVGDPSNPFYSEYHAIIEQFQMLHKQMEENRKEILKSGRSVPTIRTQVV